MKRALSRKNLWDVLPSPLKATAATVLSILPRALLLGSEYRRWNRLLEEAQWWSKEQSQSYQVRELRRVCEFASKRSKFYRNMFREVGFEPDHIRSSDDISVLPIIDRKTVRENLEEICTVDPGASNVDYVMTNGTSGEPLRLYMGPNRHAVEYAHLVLSWARVGYRLGDQFAVFRGRVIPKNKVFKHEYDSLLRQHFYSTFHLNPESMASYLAHLGQIGRCFIHAYPSAIATLARWIKATGSRAPGNVAGIIAESEIVYPDQRAMVEEVFGCRYFSCYGHTEKLVFAAECEHSTDYHVWPTYGYFELVDSRGKRISTPGESGEIVGTGFIDAVTPLIRYRTGDFATYVGEECGACGRAHTVIRDIKGHRIQEFLVARDGSLIPWTAVAGVTHDDTFDGILRFQFFQEAPGRSTVKLVPMKEFSDANERKIVEKLGSKFSGSIEFSVERVAEISTTGRGKAIYVDQRIPGVHT